MSPRFSDRHGAIAVTFFVGGTMVTPFPARKAVSGSLLEPDGSRIVRPQTSPARDTFGDWSPDGMHIVFQSNRARVALTGASGPSERDARRSSDRAGRRSAARTVLLTGLLFAPWPGGPARLHGQTLGDVRPAWSGDGRSIAFQSTRDGNDEIYRLDLATGEAVRLTEHIASDAQPSWSPDGSKIVFVSDRDRDSYSGRARYQIYVMDADGTHPSRLLESEHADFMPRWSPDGRWLAFLSDRSGGVGLYVAGSEGGEVPRLLSAELESPGNPTWSPDSRRIAVDAPVGTGYDIFAVDIESGDVVNITRSPETEWYPAWSPRGERLVVGVLTGTADAGTHALVAIDAESGRHIGALTRPTPRHLAARDWWPTWSPDGSRLVFASRRVGPWRLYLIRADGSGQRRLTNW